LKKSPPLTFAGIVYDVDVGVNWNGEEEDECDVEGE
jgi:hypothetical protein